MILSDFNTEEEAKAHAVVVGQLINRDTLNGWLGGAGIYKRMKAIAVDTTHPYCDVMEAFLDSVDYNFIAGTSTGDAHITLLDSLIANEPTVGPALSALRPLVMARANVVTYPFVNITSYDFQLAKGTCRKIPILVKKGLCRIRTTADVESHNPQVYRQVTHDNGELEYKRVAGFRGIAKAGVHPSIECPSFPVMYIDDAYSVITQG
jgi:hypothetical protein